MTRRHGPDSKPRPLQRQYATLKYTKRRERPDHSTRILPLWPRGDTLEFATRSSVFIWAGGTRRRRTSWPRTSRSRGCPLTATVSDAGCGFGGGLIAGRTVTATESMKYPATVALVRAASRCLFVVKVSDARCRAYGGDDCPHTVTLRRPSLWAVEKHGTSGTGRNTLVTAEIYRLERAPVEHYFIIVRAVHWSDSRRKHRLRDGRRFGL